MRNFHVLITLSFLFLLTNCRNDPPTEQQPAETVFKDETGRGNTVIAAQLGEADNLNPLLYSSNYAGQIVGEIFQSLTSVDPVTLELIPLLAKENAKVTELQTDGTFSGVSFTYEIKEEAVWPNGSPVTAEDYVFTLKVLMNPEVPANNLRSYLDPLSKIVTYADNPQQLSVIVDSKYMLNETIAGAGFYILPKYHYDPEGLLDEVDINELLNVETAKNLAATNPKLKQFAENFSKPFFAREVGGVVGSGPYQLKSWEVGQRITIEKKENWWGDALAKESLLFEAKVDEITYEPIQDQTAATVAVSDKQVDVRPDMTPAIFAGMQADTAISNYYNFETPTRFATYYWAINTKRPTLSDKRVRKAIAYVVDVENVIADVYDGGLTRIASPILPMMPGYNADLEPIPFDIQKAKDLLAEAGWTDSNNNGTVDKVIDGKLTELVVELMIAPRETHQAHALIIQEEAIKAGIGIEIATKERTQFAQDLRGRNFDLATTGTGFASPNSYDPKQRWHTESDTPDGFNYTGFGSAASDAIIDELRTTMDEDKRAELLRAFQKMIYEEQPVIYLWSAPNYLVIHKRFDAKAYSLRPNYFPGSFDLVTN